MCQTKRDFRNSKQFDCVEFLRSMLEHLWNEQANNQNLDEHIFGGHFQETLCCICANVENWGK